MASRTTTDFQHHYLLTYPLTKVLLGTPTLSIISLIQKTWSEPFSYFVNLNYTFPSREIVNNLVLGSVLVLLFLLNVNVSEFIDFKQAMFNGSINGFLLAA